MSALTLPGEIPGLLRRGSPVFAIGQPAVVLGPDDRPEAERHGEWLVMACSGEWEPPVYADCDVEFMPLSRTAAEMTLDLADATGRAHARWLLAATVAATVADPESNGVEDIELAFFGSVCDDADSGAGHGPARSVCGWFIQTPAGHCWTWTTTDERTEPLDDPAGSSETPLEALNDLDPNNPLRLLDGALWVDVEAMRRIALHVWGEMQAKAKATLLQSHANAATTAHTQD